MSGEIEKEPVLPPNRFSFFLDPEKPFRVEEEEKEVIEIGKKIYFELRERGLNLIEPRAVEGSLNPDAPRTLMDLLGESADRARKLNQEILTKEKTGRAWRETHVIRIMWRGLKAGALESGDDKIAKFIEDFTANL